MGGENKASAPTADLEAHHLGFIGGGNMAQAIIGSILRAANAPPQSALIAGPHDIVVSEPDDPRRAACAALGVRAVWDNAAAADADLLILAVKPQILPAALDSLRGRIDINRTVVISIAAGRPLAFIEQLLPPRARVVRVMPNTPLLVGAGISVLCAGAHATPADMTLAQRVFALGGRTLTLPESVFDAVTAVSGSGPAYFFLFTEALRAAGIAAGLPPDAADLLAHQTFVGAARLAESSGENPAKLREAVTSPGGTTAAALAIFENRALQSHVREAVAAATARGAQLAQS